MTRTRLRLAGFAVALAALFGGGYAVGAQFPVDDAPAHEMDHADSTHADSTHADSTHADSTHADSTHADSTPEGATP